jgi:hypothetical protein
MTTTFPLNKGGERGLFPDYLVFTTLYSARNHIPPTPFSKGEVWFVDFMNNAHLEKKLHQMICVSGSLRY